MALMCLSPLSALYFYCFVTTRVGVIRMPFCTKPNSGVTVVAIFSLVGNDTDSCFGGPVLNRSIEPFHVAVAL